MNYRFCVPPGWPQPPEGWVPPDGWRPDPSWPPAPPNWQFWVAATAPPVVVPPVAAVPVVGPPAVAVPVVAAASVAPQVVAPSPAIPADHRPGLFGGRKKQLETENERLRAEVTRLLGLDPVELAAEATRRRDELDGVLAEIASARQQLADTHVQRAAAHADLVETHEELMLQEAGIYQYLHPLDDAVAYKDRLTVLQQTIKEMARHNGAVHCANNWTVNGSSREGAAMVRDFSKLMLRAYNAEADNGVRNVKPHRVQAVVDRLGKVRDTIARLGKTMNITITAEYHAARVQEVRLTADYLGKVEEEKERVRAERERQREEERAQREFEREKARLHKEQSHYRSALARLQASGDTAAAHELEAKLQEIQDAIAGVDAREANIRAGYVYVISNIGAFGPDMVKIGMTRRLEPQDRIRELGDASVPFRFDTHALVFSEDAVGLEARLHAALADRKVNQVNTQREFFYAGPGDVRAILQAIAGQHLLEYHEVPEALEWRASGSRTGLGRPEAATVPA